MDIIEHLPQKKHHPILVGISIFFLFVAGLMLWFLWIIAATGLVQLPIFSDFAYEKPEPVHVVTAGVPVETYVHSFVTKEVVERVQAGRGALSDTSLVLTIPDNALTASARSFSEQTSGLMFDMQSAQVAVDPTIGFEIFLPVDDNEMETAVKVHVWSTSENGVLSVMISDVWIGSYHLPSWLVGVVADKYLQSMLLDLNQELSRYVSISSLYFEDSSVTLAGDLNVELLELIQ
jgi:hypothetical protein